MKDFVHEDVSGGAASFARNIDISSAALEMFLPHPANINAPLHRIAPAPKRNQRQPHTNPNYREWGKQVMDAFLVLLAAPMAVVVTLLCALALWIEGGQPFYQQQRLGRNGRLFTIWKLRTMVRDADASLQACLAADPALRREWNSTQKLKRDPRITPVGALLRKTSLDELPQLWNVLKGEMSLVGPRPMMPEQLPLYGDARAYFSMRPGITGIWQVSARNEKEFAHRADLDSTYFNTVSIGCDIKLLLKTVGVVMRRTGY